MAGNPSTYQSASGQFRNAVAAIFDQVKAQFPSAWAKCLASGDDGEFNGRVAWACQQAGIPAFRNGKRGNPNDLSKDILVFENPTGARDRSNRFVGIELIDFIPAHERGDAAFGWGDVTVVPGADGVPWMPDGAAVAPVDMGGGTAPGPTPAGPTSWEPKHAALLARFGPQSSKSASTVRRIAEQFAWSFPGEGWGHKAAAAGRPPSDNVMARQSGGGLIGFEILPTMPSPIQHNLAGQHFIAVTGIDHLGTGAPQPGPTPGPTPQPPRPTPAPTRIPDYEALGGDAIFRQRIGVPLQADYQAAGQTLNDGSAVWFARPIYDAMREMVTNGTDPHRAIDVAIAKHRPTWRAILGLPPL